jgi:predicted dehydrogenase
MKAVGCAVIGLGMIGREHVKILNAHPRADLLAVCDIRPELRADNEAAGYRFLDDVDACLALPGLEAVWICTPQATHRAIVEAALARGLHVMCEKPIAHDLADAAALAGLPEGGPLLAIGHTLRFQSQFLDLKRTVESGALGDIVQMGAVRNVPDYEGRILSGRTTPAVEVAVHDIDMMLWLAGPATEVTAMAPTIAPCGHGPDAVTGLIRFASGAVGTIGANWITPTHTGQSVVQVFSVFGTGGTAVLDTSMGSLRVFGTEGPQFRDASYLSEVYGIWGGALATEDAHFLACVRDGATWPVTRIEAVTALRTALALDESAGTGRPVML